MVLSRSILLFALVLAVVLVGAQPAPTKKNNANEKKNCDNFIDVDIDLLSGDDGKLLCSLVITERGKRTQLSTLSYSIRRSSSVSSAPTAAPTQSAVSRSRLAAQSGDAQKNAYIVLSKPELAHIRHNRRPRPCRPLRRAR
jgi:hypothetical protein